MLRWTWLYSYHFETQVSILWGIYSEVGLLDHMLILFSFFRNHLKKLFSTVAVSFYIPANHAKRFQFLHIFADTCDFLLFFNGSNHHGYEVIPPCDFNLHFPNDQYAEHLFICLLAMCISSLEKYMFKTFAHFWIGLFVLQNWGRSICAVIGISHIHLIKWQRRMTDQYVHHT